MSLTEKTKELTLEEKANLLCGYTNMSTYPVDRLGIPSLKVSDGPNGLRIEKPGGNSLSGIANTLPSTCFPSGVVIASSWNEDLTYEIGKAISEECIHYGINVVLGPAINIKRNPLAGRNFEYYSEDPLLSGDIAASYVAGVQTNPVGSCLKHFACNNNEKYRFVGDSIVDERALHEIYLKPFEIAVKKSHPLAIMSAYNKINGTHCSENTYTQIDMLRQRWGFDGITMTDWGGIVSRDTGLKGGTDLEMPGQIRHSVTLLMEKVKSGEINEELLDQSVNRILSTIDKTRTERKEADFEKDYQLAVKVEEEGAVLLKNEGLLPLSKEKSYLVIGDFFTKIRYQGSGSALLNPYKLLSHKEVFDREKVQYDYLQGFREETDETDAKLEEEVLKKLEKDDREILFFGGLNDYVESEGFDRDNMKIPANQVSLLEKIFALHKKVVLVLHNGSAIEADFLDKADAILDLLLPGEGGAEAGYHLLFGDVSPSGKLAETWVKSYKDVPFGEKFTESRNEVYYESIYVGYRYYLEHPELVRYPFGYGLSYTTFQYSNLKTEKKENSIVLTFTLANTGSHDGKEIVQVYVSHKGNLPMPVRELKGFRKVFLEKGESKEVTIEIPTEALEVYDVKRKEFVLEDGDYTFLVGTNSVDLALEAKLHLEGETIENPYSEKVLSYYKDAKNIREVPTEVYEELLGRPLEKITVPKKITLETRMGDYTSLFGKFFRKCTVGVGLHQYKKACKMKDGPEKERMKKAGLFVYRLMPNNSLRSLCYSSSGMFKYNLACGIKEMVNNHFLKGLILICRKDK